MINLCENYSHTYPSLAKEQTQLSDKKLCAALNFNPNSKLYYYMRLSTREAYFRPNFP